MLKKAVKYAMVLLATMIAIRLMASGEKELIAVACASFFLMPYIYNEKSNIYSLAQTFREQKVSQMMNIVESNQNK